MKENGKSRNSGSGNPTNGEGGVTTRAIKRKKMATTDATTTMRGIEVMVVRGIIVGGNRKCRWEPRHSAPIEYT